MDLEGPQYPAQWRNLYEDLLVYSRATEITVRQGSLYVGCTAPIKFFTLSQNTFPMAFPPARMVLETNVLLQGGLASPQASLLGTPVLPGLPAQ